MIDEPRRGLPVPTAAHIWAVLGFGVVVWVTQVVQGAKQAAQLDMVVLRLDGVLEVVKDHETRLRTVEPWIAPLREKERK